MVATRMKSKDSSETPSVPSVVMKAITDGAIVRAYVLDQDAKFPRIIEGVPRSIAAGRDGRQRIVVAIDTATEHSEVRVPIDRVVRIEALDPEGNTHPSRTAGEMPKERPPTVSAERMRVDTPAARVRKPNAAERETPPSGRPARPIDHETQPILQPNVSARRARPPADPVVDDRRPTEPAFPSPRRR